MYSTQFYANLKTWLHLNITHFQIVCYENKTVKMFCNELF